MRSIHTGCVTSIRDEHVPASLTFISNFLESEDIADEQREACEVAFTSLQPFHTQGSSWMVDVVFQKCRLQTSPSTWSWFVFFPALTSFQFWLCQAHSHKFARGSREFATYRQRTQKLARGNIFVISLARLGKSLQDVFSKKLGRTQAVQYSIN